MASTIQIRVDDDLKNKSDQLFKDLGTDTTSAIRMFLTQAVAYNGFPFEIKRTIGNILWFIFGGLLGGLAWIFAGCIWCITIIGIPVGLQCFKFATLAFWPFGKEIVYGNGMFSFLVNLIWIIFFGWEMALGNLIVGCIWCITIVGIPFGKQFFKMARLSFMPFGASVIG